ncbi:transmembrane channel-like protein 7 isoform X2 [Sycon ciliatum]|uniref:transmembrane channel-like protein 7 isoform X2 n=1 Tax=Sycon ciliatum TaxID=27933 RepID=UPI0020AECF62|eukprot:scpid28172/ scgid12715/ Transmembrane channel-like protein 7
MTDQGDWQANMFPPSQRSSDRMVRDDVEMANFGVADEHIRNDYNGQGPGYVDPDYEDEQYYPPVPGHQQPPNQSHGQQSQLGMTRSMSGRAGGGMVEGCEFMHELPSRREQASTAATIRRRQTVHRSMTRPQINSNGRESPQFVEDEVDDVLPSLREAGRSASSAHAHRQSMRRRPTRPAGQRVSAYRQVKWQIGLKWKLLKESMANFFYHLGLWRGTMKRIEGRFGTGVVSYFLFLRWLVFLNLLLSLLVISFIFIPQLTVGRTKTSNLGTPKNDSTEWYSYIQQTITGEGYLEDTHLFMGIYTNTTIQPGSYSMPYAYLLTLFALLLVSLLLLVFSMAKAYRESYVQDSGGLYSYSNKTFGAWEFTITDESTARLKSISIKKDFEEELQNEKALSEKWTFDKTMKAYSRRVVINLIILLMWAAAGTAIYFATTESIDANTESRQITGDISYGKQFTLFIRGLAATLTISAFDVIFPTVFQQLSLLEMWRTPRTEVRATLLRTIAMRLSSLGVLMASIFIDIQGCDSGSGGGGGGGAMTPNNSAAIQATMGPTTSIVMVTMSAAASNTSAVTTAPASGNCPPCWESFAGQELYQLTIIDFFIIVGVTLFGETIWRFAADHSKFIKDKIGPPEFFIAKSVLELLYAQALLWLGVFFSPLICIICILKFIIYFYCKKFSLFHNLKPSDRPYRAARNSNIFRALLLLTLFLCLIPIGYAIVRITPSAQCGPFRGKEHIYDIIPELIDKAPGWLETIIDFIGSAAFIAPLLILMLLVIYYYYALSRAQKENINLLKDQLQLEGRDKQFLIGKVQRMQTTLAGLSGTV